VLITIAAAGRRVMMPAEVAEVVRGAGVRWASGEKDHEALSLAFPRS